MAKRKGSPKKHSPKKPRTEAPPFTDIYKGVKFIDIGADVGIYVLNMLGLWNSKASEILPGDENDWNESMEFKATHSEECLGLFVKAGRVESRRLIGFMKGEVILSPKDSNKGLMSTNYDIQPAEKCIYTASDADGNVTVYEFDCYVRGTGIREPFNGQLCNHTCSAEHQNCQYVNIEPVEVSLVDGEVTHTLRLPLVGVQTIKDIQAGSECLVHYGELMLSDEESDGFIACQCLSCANDRDNGKFVMA